MRKSLLCLLLSILLLPCLSHCETVIPGLTYTDSLPLQYADRFSVDFYEGGYAYIEIVEGDRILLVPEGAETPAGLDPSVQIVHEPKRIYVAATGAMALFAATDSLDLVRLSSQQADSWYVEAAGTAMREGRMLYAGKYSEPDYELLVREGCDLIIENTMIYHTPKVREMLLTLGFPVIVERSSYEKEPLGRMEWIKLYGVLTGRLAEAEAFFADQVAPVEALSELPATEKTVVFFYINDDGTAVVRSSTDTVARMIGAAGGTYLALTEDTSATNIEISMEEFYAGAMDADILIYNGSIDGVSSMKDLLAKSDLLSDLKAVRNGSVWGCTRYLYQATASVGTQIGELHSILTDTEDALTFFYRLED